MISRGYINILYIETKYNFAVILTKHWGYQDAYIELIQPVFHHKGNAAALFLDGMLEVDVSINDEDAVFGILGSERTTTITGWNADCSTSLSYQVRSNTVIL